MFTAGVRVWRIRSSWSSSSAGIRDSKSSGNSLSVNSSTRGIEADLRQRESSFSFSYTKTGSNTVGTVMDDRVHISAQSSPSSFQEIRLRRKIMTINCTLAFPSMKIYQPASLAA